MILSEALILLVLQLQTQQMMTSLIRSHIVYLLQTHHFVLEIYENSSLNVWFHYDFITIRDSGLLFWTTLYTCRLHSARRRIYFGRLLPVCTAFADRIARFPHQTDALHCTNLHRHVDTDINNQRQLSVTGRMRSARSLSSWIPLTLEYTSRCGCNNAC